MDEKGAVARANARARNKRYYYKDLDKTRARCRARGATYYKKNREKCNATARAWRAKNPDYFRIHAVIWRRKKPLNYLLNNVSSRANKAGLQFSLRAGDLTVPKLCPWLGIPLIWNHSNRDNWPSVDRIDSTKGYTPDNVEIISWRANTIKNSSTFDELARMGKRAAKLARQRA